MPPRVLIVEDERDVATAVAFNLRAEGLEVTAVETASDAFRELAGKKIDLVLLDLMLPDASGLEVLRAIKTAPATRDIPVVIASARAEQSDRIVGLELGADDYVIKPYSAREIVLRTRIALRRLPPSPPSSGEVVRFGMLTIDRPAHRVFVEGNEVTLTNLEFRLLTTMLDRKNRTQTRDQLLQDVWQLRGDTESRTVDTHVKRLREKLGTAGVYVQTVRGVGYRFAANPDESPPTE